VTTVPAPVRTRVQKDQPNKDKITKSSLTRLGRGGRARFARIVISHHAVVRGRTACMPRIRASVRVWFRSYVLLAKQKRAEEVSPCANIKRVAPEKLQGV